jgi:hypothetical protein
MLNSYVKNSLVILVLLLTTAVLAENLPFSGKISYEYFAGNWKCLPDFAELKPLQTGKMDSLKLTLFDGKEHYACLFRGRIMIPNNGRHAFSITSDDGSRLLIDEQLVVDNDGQHGRQKRSGAIELKAGEHDVRIEYFNVIAKNFLQVEYEGLADKGLIDYNHWLYFGWQHDYPKSLSFMSGALMPGRKTPAIQYGVVVDGKSYYPDEFAADRRQKINWYLAENFLPSSVSEWRAAAITVKVQHVANRVFDDRATVVLTRVELKNNSAHPINAELHVSADPQLEVPLSRSPDVVQAGSMVYQLSLPRGKTQALEFVAAANGNLSSEQLSNIGTFSQHYNSIASYYKFRIEQTTRPEKLPDQQLVNLYRATQINMWQSIVRASNGDIEIRGSGGNAAGYYPYDRIFSHDVPNMVIQFLKEGDFDLAKSIMASSYYQKLGVELEQNYLDAIPKYIIPYAIYLQLSGDVDYFTDPVRENLQRSAHAIHGFRDFNADLTHYGIMQKSNTLDNGADYLLVDNFAALHGLAAYQYIVQRLANTEEIEWIEKEIADLNRCLDAAIQSSMQCRGVVWYMAALDDDSYFWKRGYDGNWICTSMMMSTFPWDAVLMGCPQTGIWAKAFDTSIAHALAVKRTSPYDIPEDSWGAWWTHEYGSAYNAGMGLQVLYSDQYRTLPLKNVQWLLHNQCAPFQWGESFDRPSSSGDWCNPAADLETWALSFIKQTLLESIVSVKADGQIIIGRGVPDEWLKAGQEIVWRDVRVNDNYKIDLFIKGLEKCIQIQVDPPTLAKNLLIDFPLLKDNIDQVSVGGKSSENFDDKLGKIPLVQKGETILITLKRPS